MTSTSGLISNVGQANYSAAKMGIVGLSKSIALDMARFGVRSNCVAPFAWSRTQASLPDGTAEERARLARTKAMTPERVPTGRLPGQRRCGRRHRADLRRAGQRDLPLTPPRLQRTVHSGTDWTVDAIARRAMPALRTSFTPLDTSAEFVTWDPV